MLVGLVDDATATVLLDLVRSSGGRVLSQQPQRLGSDAVTGHIDDFSTWVDDLAALWADWRAATPGPHVLAGHSMGGHGALVIALRNPGRYRSVSAFSPINNPMDCPWGQKAFSRYLGEERSKWREWDACVLISEASQKLPLLVDQGDRDDFLDSQLKPQLLQAQAKAQEHPLWLRLQPGYDHSYYFIASFIEDHLRHHAQALAG